MQGGVLLGPSALGRNKAYLHRIFPPWSIPTLESVASIGLLFFLFLVGLEFDLSSIRRTGRRGFSIAVAGISLPFVCGTAVAFLLRKTVQGADKAGYAQFLVFMGVALSITAFPVLARILAELKLLTTQVGETAMAAAAFNDVVAWALLALAVALAGGGSGSDHRNHKSPLVSIWVLLSCVAFVVFMLVVVRPLMTRVAKKCSTEHEAVDEAYICVTLVGVMVSGFTTDLIGIHSIFGAFVFGITIPKEGDFARRLMEKIEDFVTGLLLPLYFASSGLKTDVTKIRGVEAWGLLGLVVVTACTGKIVGTFVVAIVNKMAVRDALTLGLLMNTKGLVELIVLNIGKETKVLNDEIFAILVLMALFTTFITTPIVMAAYKPSRATSSSSSSSLNYNKHSELHIIQPSSSSATSNCFNLTPPPRKELRVLACVHGTSAVPSLINLIESTRGSSTTKSAIKLYIMHLVELTERSSSIVLAQRVRKNGFPFRNRLRRGEPMDRVTDALEAYGQLDRVKVRPMIAISALQTMHQDVCQVAEAKQVSLLILPFHKREVESCDGSSTENVGSAWCEVNQLVMRNAPCPVAVFVDRGFGRGPTSSLTRGVCVVFLGGPDDRVALALGGRMAEHPGLQVTVLRFVEREGTEGNDVISRALPDDVAEMKPPDFKDRQIEKDEMAIEEFRKRWEGTASYVEKVGSNVAEEVVAVGRSTEQELVIVGKRQLGKSWDPSVAAERAELGTIGDMLASSSNGVAASVLVIQHQGTVDAAEV